MHARTTGAPSQRAPSTHVLPWIGVVACFALTLLLCFYPLAPSDILPLTR
jgi:hypothetical protein